jgi:hypothetical protein
MEADSMDTIVIITALVFQFTNGFLDQTPPLTLPPG